METSWSYKTKEVVYDYLGHIKVTGYNTINGGHPPPWNMTSPEFAEDDGLKKKKHHPL